MYSRKKLSEAALFIEDENENEELKIDGWASSLDCYSDPEELPQKELEKTIEIVGSKDINPWKLAAKMKRIQWQIQLLEELMHQASKKRLWADHSKLQNKHRNIKKHMRCLNISELRELS